VHRPVPAKLVVIGGALAGEVFTLNVEDTSLGRDASNTIAVADVSLSRKHCGFRWHTDQWHIRDLGSSNGTFVNGVQIDSHPLTKGDRITAGSSVLLYVADGTHPLPIAPAQPLREDAPLPVTSRLPLDNAAYLTAAGPPSGHEKRIEHGLRALLAISGAINSVTEERQLHRELLDLLFEAVPAAQGAILTVGSDRQLAVQVVHPEGARGALPISATTVRRVLDEKCGIVSSEEAQLSGGADATSGASTGARSLMIVPVAVQDRALGAIYLASSGGRFSDDHLQLVTAVARIAATALENVRRIGMLERNTERLQSDLQLTHQMVGQSAAVRSVYDRIAKLARVETTVLITGETGTGKELCARAIHLNSVRARRPFVAVNCAALSEGLLESELFGHERGAFTNAFTQKKGKLEIADGGTVLLDEVGELAPPLQSKLLRVLQEREFDRVGGVHPIKVNLRILAATNRNLADEVASGRFRHDLFYRLNVVAIDLPPLRERRDDVPLLARYFLGVNAGKIGRPVHTIAAAAMKALVDYDWPGNVRELENTIERAIVLGTTEEILFEDLPDTLTDGSEHARAEDDRTLHAQVLAAKRRAVIDAHRRAAGNYTEAAKLLGVHPNYLHRLIRNLNIKRTLEEAEA
jgi:transcriptional regulator with GAF, ATPase, and Fis domain